MYFLFSQDFKQLLHCSKYSAIIVHILLITFTDVQEFTVSQSFNKKYIFQIKNWLGTMLCWLHAALQVFIADVSTVSTGQIPTM